MRKALELEGRSRLNHCTSQAAGIRTAGLAGYSSHGLPVIIIMVHEIDGASARDPNRAGGCDQHINCASTVLWDTRSIAPNITASVALSIRASTAHHPCRIPPVDLIIALSELPIIVPVAYACNMPYVRRAHVCDMPHVYAVCTYAARLFYVYAVGAYACKMRYAMGTTTGPDQKLSWDNT